MKLFRTIKEVALTSLPLAAITVIVCCFVAPMPRAMDYVKLLVGYAGVVFGSSIFLVGLDQSIIPIGKHVGGSLIKLKKPAFIVLFGIIFGLLATVAEPALWVLAKQTHMLMPYVKDAALVWVLSSGVGLFVGFSLWRIMANLNIKWVFALLYLITFACVLFVPAEFIALAFDGSGATTGDVSVPFILALGLGVSATMSKSKTNDDTFGIIGLASVGPILALFLYGIIKQLAFPDGFPAPGDYNPGGESAGFARIVAGNLSSVAFALIPVMLVFLPFQFCFIKLPKKEFKQILLGTATVYVGLLVFLSGIDYGFAYASKYIGEIFMAEGRPDWFKWMLLPIGFILGAAITMSEPAVTVLGEQLEEITNGHTKRMTIRVTLALGIGAASLLAMVKILTETNILWYLLPLYAISLAMMPGTSKLFVGLAFDSGGVSGGALTSAFLTPFTLGAAQAIAARGGGGEGAVSAIVNGFGIIAFVSVTPLISVQALGMIYELRMRAERKRLAAAEQAQLSELLALARETQEETALAKKKE